MAIYQPTPGGERLKGLRELAGKTQLDVELDGHLGTGYLQRVESGKVQHPERDTLERILSALGARYSEQREVLELFGYRMGAPLPGEDEISWAVEACSTELHSAVFPAYLLDCAHRLLAWNAFVPSLFPLDVMRTAAKPSGRKSLSHLLFNPQYGVLQRIQNVEAFFTAQLRTFRLELQPFIQEAWSHDFLRELRQDELFEQYWLRSAQEQQTSLAARPLVPLQICDLSGHSLQFRLLSEPFAQDRRFRLIYYLPADPASMQWCLDVIGEREKGELS
jgi:transcriptional regulator with XRE-family HTH domain